MKLGEQSEYAVTPELCKSCTPLTADYDYQYYAVHSVIDIDEMKECEEDEEQTAYEFKRNSSCKYQSSVLLYYNGNI